MKNRYYYYVVYKYTDSERRTGTGAVEIAFSNGLNIYLLFK